MSNFYIWNKCSFKSHLNNNNLPLSEPFSLPGCDINFPYILISDEIFHNEVTYSISKRSIRNRLDRKIFNYRYDLHLYDMIFEFKLHKLIAKINKSRILILIKKIICYIICIDYHVPETVQKIWITGFQIFQ